MLNPQFKPSENVWVIENNNPIILKVETLVWKQYEIIYYLSGYNFGKTKIEVALKQDGEEDLLIFKTKKEAQKYIN